MVLTRQRQLTYLPKVDNPRMDWVASVAVPAFMAHNAQNKVRSFATIGTGAGLDAIAAVEIFDLERLAITDLHQAVVDAAAENVRTATAGFGKVCLFAAAGDILAPLVDQGGGYDLIYGDSSPLFLPVILTDFPSRKLAQHSSQS